MEQTIREWIFDGCFWANHFLDSPNIHKVFAAIMLTLIIGMVTAHLLR